ncbi:nuclear transport factor 2 family protein [Amycolatopsis acidicola]|uniref:Nuclear transport factor 2 family protein n=1 Tax=Amycolatopsis acidicola TaxID=2596893 RepID=A0A5N0V8V0_9PSEU|nr:nuclear transport factor 2 family protein [Amycolatopsis acidicola]KAA9161663.1 nuclear transport factor 2 family protein [Amycolatopsis acidicola]
MDLVALEEIKRVKYRYLRCVDLKQWDDVADTFTADAVADYGTPAKGDSSPLEGRDAILAFLRQSLDNDLITTHFAGQPEIEIDGDTATGTWAFQDKVISVKHGVVIAGAAFYEDAYRRDEDGRWRIARTGYTRTYELTASLKDLPNLKFTAHRWAE